jgi:hypothetical protein
VQSKVSRLGQKFAAKSAQGISTQKEGEYYNITFDRN